MRLILMEQVTYMKTIFLNILLVAVTVSDCYQLNFNFNFVANILLVLRGMLVSYDASCR